MLINLKRATLKMSEKSAINHEFRIPVFSPANKDLSIGRPNDMLPQHMSLPDGFPE